ncbi:acyl-CoA dehydrogenase family protein [Nocardia neocaledoniensis]|uniref:acyl-CoA dehydrogenase family protein n=1 Tax=Nocardia neocaledoniensis TaxID=236511 RepID=UPI0024548F26|nr:acyl-CoA dehydrogenase family protein [Nocardia neocaledoniensis]
MEFELTDEQRAFQESVRKFLEANAAPAQVRRFVDHDPAYDQQLWRTMATELGLHGIAIDEEYGGAGAGLVELGLVLEEAGRALLCSPLFATVMLAATALQNSDDKAAQARWLPQIAAGELVATVALAEERGPYHLEDTETRATKEPRGWVLNGRKRFVLDAESAGLILVSARTDTGLSLFAVKASASGLTRTAMPLLDPTRPLSEIELVNVDARLVGVDGAADQPLRRTLALSTIGLAAEQVGVTQACLDMAVGYAKTRVQFGRPIGSFQAIKHKCADMLVNVEAARSMAYFAAWSAANDTDDLTLLAEMTGAYVSEAAFRSASENLQIHGGIGYTWEHDAHLLFKRAVAAARILRSPTDRREAIATSVGL